MLEQVAGVGCPCACILPQKRIVSLKLGKTASQATMATSATFYLLPSAGFYEERMRF